MSGLLFVVSAASGTGKTSLVKALLERVTNLHVSVSHTTRGQRPGELDGVHYHFTTKENFLSQVEDNGFIEYAEVFGNYYGTSQATVKQQLAKGHDVLLEIDWQGAQQVRRIFPESKQIFILPPSQFDLRQRLSNRGTDAVDVIEHRLSCAVEDMQQYVNFDYIIINDDFNKALHDLESVITANRLMLAQQVQRHHKLIEQLITPNSE
ncbi:guanylate kinase [Acinetobacter baylyi]|uniref:Guanylate kinase n=2 Tax=Acinetobacter baylyi TaxID=202950 RepID=KGUA_ACIAD|nr:guanylate kinase [Acinetobacter baylyi]Q6F7H0.1 RecName: Full=Guanylate kinase; AltName: Full=GMP kinase [Acinetobacter baylyi ADP1]ENV55030.1 guanylate kinase [Acinetobacter baylyi DSM 14961 = CIP 107474]KAF2371175.1 guanylate kinase [Acinetobacter baylyi]KAF2374616.1 guanylate kinase [Acinetobacter baylyi]KAF2377012.1 guanylate kinase [Acinetobacter baylyi]KAF2381749.1 guanylate kinase [Acinetobacter baylyi]